MADAAGTFFVRAGSHEGHHWPECPFTANSLPESQGNQGHDIHGKFPDRNKTPSVIGSAIVGPYLAQLCHLEHGQPIFS